MYAVNLITQYFVYPSRVIYQLIEIPLMNLEVSGILLWLAYMM